MSDDRLRCPVGLGFTATPSGVILDDSSTQGRWALDRVDPSLIRFLLYAREPRDRRALVAFLMDATACSEAVAGKTVETLRTEGMLVREGDVPNMPKRASLERWAAKGWREAFYFHARTNLLPKTDYSSDEAYEEDVAAMRRKLRDASGTLPSNYKDYEDAQTIELAAEFDPGPPPALGPLLSEACPVETGRAMNLAELGWYLRLAFGETATRRLPVSGRHVGKTSPSGGSRHPTEVYPVVLDVEGIEPGLYHYSVRRHVLERLRSGAYSEVMRKEVFLSDARPPFTPRVVFLFTTIFERSMFRYREPRSYRVVHFDLGHLMQTAATIAAGRRRPCYRAYAMHEREVDAFVGIDGITEASMTFLALG